MLYGEMPEGGFRFTVANPKKEAFLRLPKSDEIAAHMDAQKTIRRMIGRRQSQTETLPNAKADLDLFAQLRLSGDDFDEFEARNAIQKLTSSEVVDCERSSDGYTVTLKTPFGESVHVLGIPTARQLADYKRTVVKSRELPHNQEELRYRTQSTMDLYDAAVQSSSGYADGTEVPAHHKFAIAIELVHAIEELDPAFDPNS
ncbi:MAG TPA: hypothetical protein VN841_29175 [Bryobacteraceae bacterium]|nr:hypothetical protein [Bryobacteraceae bacterium]